MSLLRFAAWTATAAISWVAAFVALVAYSYSPPLWFAGLLGLAIGATLYAGISRDEIRDRERQVEARLARLNRS